MATWTVLVYDRRQCRKFESVGGHKLRLRAIALALRGPPLQPLTVTLTSFYKASPIAAEYN